MAYHSRKLHRLRTWDYSDPGYYFITICTKDMRCLLSRISDTPDGPAVHLTEIGIAAENAWKQMDRIVPYIHTDYYCIMPNHIHGIIVIDEHPGIPGRSIPDLVHAYKSTVTRAFNRMVPAGSKNQLWQDSYYDEIIRSETMLFRTRQYIEDNPRKWSEDDLFTT